MTPMRTVNTTLRDRVIIGLGALLRRLGCHGGDRFVAFHDIGNDRARL